MTTYALDTTAGNAANAITGEQLPINTIGLGSPALLFLDQCLFYATGFSVTYTDVDGATSTLTLGDDYSFMFEISGVVAGNKIWGAVKINNQQLNGTLTFAYHTVGGQWRYFKAQIAAFLDANPFSARQAYLSLTTFDPVYAGGSTTPILLNSAQALTLAQAAGPLPMALTPIVLPLPNSRKLYVEGGLVIDGNGLQKVN